MATNLEFGNNKNKKLLGLNDEGKEIVKCADCGKLLMVFQKTKSNDDLKRSISTKILVDCGFCGGFSYVKTIDGQFYPGAADDNIVFEPLDSEKARMPCDILFGTYPKL